jgi:hypothetical protein
VLQQRNAWVFERNFHPPQHLRQRQPIYISTRSLVRLQSHWNGVPFPLRHLHGEINMKPRIALHLIVVVTSLLFGALSAHANVLVNGGFDSEPNYGSGVQNGVGFSALTGSQIPGWTIEAGHAVTIHDTSTYPFITGPFSVNMDGEGFNGHNANLYQDFASVAGQQYQVQFDWQGWIATGAQLDVSVTDTVTSAVVYHGNFAWATGTHHVSAVFAGTGNPLRLRVQQSPESGTNDNGFIVDNFAVDTATTTTANATPVPTVSEWMLALMCALLVGWAFVARRYRGR